MLVHKIAVGTHKFLTTRINNQTWSNTTLALSVKCGMLRGKAVDTYLQVFGLIKPNFLALIDSIPHNQGDISK